jgi:hypothetical protein
MVGSRPKPTRTGALTVGLEIDGVIDQLLGPRLPPNLKRRRVEHHQRRNRQEQNQKGKEAPRASISLRPDAPQHETTRRLARAYPIRARNKQKNGGRVGSNQ